MQVLYHIAILSSFVLLVQCNAQRRARFFLGPHTSTIKSTHLMTSVVPSSCVEVEPTLPVCRSVRNLHGFPTVGGYVLQTIQNIANVTPNQYLKAAVDEPEISNTPLGWMEYLGFSDYTVTKVEHVTETVIVQDPNVVVTFSIKGCKPSELPQNIIRCDPLPSITIEEILPTSTVGYAITPTASVEIVDDNYNGPVVEATETSEYEEKVIEATQPLQDLK